MPAADCSMGMRAHPCTKKDKKWPRLEQGKLTRRLAPLPVEAPPKASGEPAREAHRVHEVRETPSALWAPGVGAGGTEDALPPPQRPASPSAPIPAQVQHIFLCLGAMTSMGVVCLLRQAQLYSPDQRLGW